MNAPWPQNRDFDSFKRSFPMSQDRVYRELFLHFREQIKVQREETAVRNLEIIFQATFKLANRNGFHAMSLRDLSRETGISMGGLYNYITNKEDLAHMIEEFAGARIGDYIFECADDISEPRDKIECLTRAYIYTTELFQPWFFFMFMEAKSMSPENKQRAKGLELRSIERMQVHIQAAYDSLSPAAAPNIQPIISAGAMIALMENWYLKHWHYKEEGISVDTYADNCVAFVLKSLS